MSLKIRCNAQWADDSLKKGYDHAAPFRLVSIHKHVANIAVEGWPHLLMFVDSTLPRGPASVGLSTDDFSQFLSFTQGYPEGRYSPGQARLIGQKQEFVIDWSHAALYSFRPPRFTPADGNKIAAASSLYRKWLLELGAKASASSVLFDIEGEDDYFRREIQTYFPALVQALLSGNTRDFIACSANLIGLGRGSTPTGDDMLYGAMMGWQYLRSAQGMPLGRPALTEDVLSKTTFLGRHMLEMGRLGLAPEPVQAFLLSVCTGRPDYAILQEVCQMGATTGVDICIGALFSINSLALSL
jgi:hypothetical protein